MTKKTRTPARLRTTTELPPELPYMGMLADALVRAANDRLTLVTINFLGGGTVCVAQGDDPKKVEHELLEAAYGDPRLAIQLFSPEDFQGEELVVS